MLNYSPFQRIRVLTEELIIAKADIDFSTNVSKRAWIEDLENQVRELMK